MRDLVWIDTLTGHHRVINPRDGSDLRRNRLGGLPQLLERLAHGIDLAIKAVGERDHGELDDLVTRWIQARRFGIDEQSLPGGDARRRFA